VETGQDLNAFRGNAVIQEVREATEDGSAMTRGDLGEGLWKLRHHVYGVFERSNEVDTEARSALVVPLPGRRDI
jgi:hypothetical protein